MSDTDVEQLRAELYAANEKLTKIRILCRTVDRGVGYRNPEDHSTYGEYAEGKNDFAGIIEAVLEGTDA